MYESSSGEDVKGNSVVLRNCNSADVLLLFTALQLRFWMESLESWASCSSIWQEFSFLFPNTSLLHAFL